MCSRFCKIAKLVSACHVRVECKKSERRKYGCYYQIAYSCSLLFSYFVVVVVVLCIKSFNLTKKSMV